jgi:hypothetical protein
VTPHCPQLGFFVMSVSQPFWRISLSQCSHPVLQVKRQSRTTCCVSGSTALSHVTDAFGIDAGQVFPHRAQFCSVVMSVQTPPQHA